MSIGTPSDLRALLTRVEMLLAIHEPRAVKISEWRDAVVEIYRGRRPSTRSRMRLALDLVVEVLGGDALTTSLDAAAVARLVEARPNLRVATINGLLRALKAAVHLGQLKSRRWFGADQLEGTRWVLVDHDAPLIAVHSREDVAKVLTYLSRRTKSWRGHRLYMLTCMYAYTGMRKNEALMMRVADVDLSKCVAWVWPNGLPLKTEASRQPVPICDVLGGVLAKWLERVDSDWLFPTITRGRPWIGGAYGSRPTERVRLAGEAVGVNGFTPQSLRHAAATHLTGHHGLSPRQVALFLRHTNLKTQARYVHAETSNLVESVRGFRYE